MSTQHVAKDLLLQFAQGNLTGDARRGVIRHLLLRCEECRLALREVTASLQSDEATDFRLPPNLVTPQMLEAERTDALQLWHGSLERLDAGQRLLLVRENPRYHTRGLQELIHHQALSRILDHTIDALDLCHLSLEIVHRLPLDRYRRADVADLRAGSLAGIANGKRLIGDLDGALDAMEQALESLDWGTGDPLEEAGVLSIYGSLLTDLGKLDEAMEVLGAAARDAREVGETQLQGKLVLQQSSSIGWFDPQRGLELAQKAIGLLQPGRSPHLDLIARYQLIILSCETGQVQEARSLFESWQLSFKVQENHGFWQSRILQLEAALARQEGDLGLCESYLRQLLDHYTERGHGHSIALTTLDLAEVLTATRRYAEAQALLDKTLPLFRQWRVTSDVLRAWLMIEEGVKGKALESVSFREASRIIRRSWWFRA